MPLNNEIKLNRKPAAPLSDWQHELKWEISSDHMWEQGNLDKSID